MKIFEVSTHHTYLNIFPIITPVILADPISILVFDSFGNRILKISDFSKTMELRFPAGKFVIVGGVGENSEYVQSEEIIVEDALKYGNSRIRKGFVYTDSPWLFLLTGDRIYVWNRETKVGKVEHYLAPDNIISHRNYIGNPCPYFIFQTGEEYSVYNVESGQIIFSFRGYVYSNNNVVVYENTNGSISIYDYTNHCEIGQFKGQYSFIESNTYYTKKDDTFYYVDESDYKLHCVRSNIVSEVKDVCLSKGKKYVLTKEFLLVLVDDRFLSKAYRIYILGCRCRTYDFCTNYDVEYFMDKSCSDIAYLFDKLVEANAAFTKISGEYKTSLQIKTEISFQTISIEKLYTEIKDGMELLHMEFSLNTYRSKHSKEKELKQLTLKTETKSYISAAAKYVASSVDANTKPAVAKDKSDVLCNSEDGALSIYVEENKIYLYDNRAKSKNSILEDLYTHNFYQNAYFTSDGKNLVLMNDSSIASLINYDDISTKTNFSIEGIGISRKNGFNGYKPEINIIPKAGAIPRWIDPISLNYVQPCDSGFYKYSSPHGDISANVQLKELYINVLTIDEIDKDEYAQLRNIYDFKSHSFADNTYENEDSKMKIKSRTALLQKPYNFEQLSVKYREFLRKYFYRTQKYDWSEELKAMSKLWKSIFDNKAVYIENPANFTDYIVLKIGYVECEEHHNSFRIFIGDNLWFLNYVSFSFDNRFIAIGAKRYGRKYIEQGYEITTSQSGVFILFDLNNKDEKIRYDMDNSGLQAVWTTAFSRKGDCAFYDSTPNSYIIRNATTSDTTVKTISNMSFLGFSTNGHYVALSKQKYIDYTHHSNERWGHQPCGSIYVYNVNDLQNTLAHFNDFSEGIKDVGVAGSVASIAFSQDECRLLAVGTDGVVVVRNLHFVEEMRFSEIFEAYVNKYYADNSIPYEIFIDDEILEYYRSYYANADRPIEIFIEENRNVHNDWYESPIHHNGDNINPYPKTSSSTWKIGYADDDDYRNDYYDNDPLDAFEGDEYLYDEWLINS